MQTGFITLSGAGFITPPGVGLGSVCIPREAKLHGSCSNFGIIEQLDVRGGVGVGLRGATAQVA